MERVTSVLRGRGELLKCNRWWFNMHYDGGNKALFTGIESRKMLISLI